MRKAWIDQRNLVAIGCCETRVDPRVRVTTSPRPLTRFKSSRMKVTEGTAVTTVRKVKGTTTTTERKGTMKNQARKPKSPTQRTFQRAQRPVVYLI